MLVISFIGKSNSGKTTLLEKVIPRLSEKGIKVGSIKHDAHSFSIDIPGKDSYRLYNAGSDVTAITSAEKLAVIKRQTSERPLTDIVNEYFSNVDIVLTEGFKRESKLKIEVTRKERSEQLILTPEDKDLLAIASDYEVNGYNVPVFNINDDEKLAEFIFDYIKSNKKCSKDRLVTKVIVDGKAMPVKDFVQEFIAQTIFGMLKSLKGGESVDNKDVEIVIKRK